ncbi:MAG: hypothetical protein Q9188_002396 [Gyalolechia gomerana]
MPGTVAEGPTVSMSFANNFWGKDDAGVQPLLERMQNAKVTSDELKGFYNTRATIEDEYARKLLALCRKPLGSSEAGTLRASLDVVRGEVESMGKSHQGIAAQMKTELEEPLSAFAGGMKERRKIVQAGIEKLYKVKQQQTQSVNKSRDRYEQDCLKIKGYLAQGHMVMGQEERKNKAKMEKTQIQLASTSNEYEAAVKALEETTGRWNRDWKAACDKFQDLEEERLDFTKSSLWTFANVASTVCVSDDASCEKIRLSLESCEVEKDINGFIQVSGTGQEIPDPPKYINFCRGDLNDTCSEASEDENFSVAQFQRTLNPAYRTSSPQPSTFESHHDPQSDLAVKMGHLQAHTPPSRETTLTPHMGQHQPPPIIDYRGQPQTQAPYQHKIDDLATVPHNEYPTDGMTMFCRTAPPSDRSSATSPMRPSSRDSQSEYSNPTSFSSQEPPSGKQSPIKHDIPVMSPTKQVQKKRSGFFSNSPFRRKSKHEKEGRDGQPTSTMTTPSSRNNWGNPNRNGVSDNSSPTRQYGQGIQTRDFQNEPSPEPVDPRANFQLNVGPNVFDVASPDNHRRKQPTSIAAKEVDPIAQALADLKGVGKQSSVRMSADRYAGVATPGPGTTSDLAAAQRGTPPPSYSDQQPIRRLDPPKPAFTSAQMQQTTRKYVGQSQEMYGSSRPRTRGSGDVPRATSPLPMRSTSPRPGYNGQQHARSASPNPYGGGRPRQTPDTSPAKQPYTNGKTSRYNSPNDIRRSASPQPQYGQQQRPHSSAGMQLQLAPDNSNRGLVSQRARGQSNARPLTYYGGQQAPHSNDAGARNRGKSVANGRQYTKEGRPILQFARALYLYKAAIPEELSFAKGDILAILNMQDDGWWEAEVTGKNGRPGLVPTGHIVSVVLPHQQRSWIGKAHFASQIVKPTYFRPGTLHQDDGTTHAKPLHPDSSTDSEEWVLVNSTPATAAQLGLFHFFQDRGPVNLVVSGPNLSSGTIGGAMEAAVCRKRAVALSYAFFSRNHDPEIIAGASRMSVKLVEYLMSHWDEAVDLYSVNVPLIEGVEEKKVMYTHALQNYWQSGSSFTETEASSNEDEDPEEKEAGIREQEAQQEGSEAREKRTRHRHRHFKWTPNFSDVYQSVETSGPGNDGWAVKEGLVRYVGEYFPMTIKLMLREQCHSAEGKLHACAGVFRGIEASDSEDRDEEAESSEYGGADSEIQGEAKIQKKFTEKLGNGIITCQLRHFVAQPYVPPLLLPEYHNRKFHIRTYVLCVGALRVYVYKDMLALFSGLPFEAPGFQSAPSRDDGNENYGEKIDMRPHLTNTCLQTTSSPSSISDSSNPQAIPFRDLDASTLTPSIKNSIQNQIFETTSDVLRAAAAQPTSFQPLTNAFEIYSVDWLVDPDCQVHLLEFHAYPDFAQSGPGGKRIIEGLWRGMLEIVLKGDGNGNRGFFGDGLGGGSGCRAEDWGMEMVLDLDMGRR